MTLSTLNGPLSGRADGQLSAVIERLGAYLTTDPDLSFQVAAYASGSLVLDAWGGPHLTGTSMMAPASVSKNIIGMSIGLLVEREELDLDATVAGYWPEFAQAGKSTVTVRELLSHQAGLPEAEPGLTWDEITDHHLGAQRLAATYPFWAPGSAFGYHALTLGNLSDELVFRVTGLTLHDFYEREIRAARDIDFFLGLPKTEEKRRVNALPIIPPLAEATRREMKFQNPNRGASGIFNMLNDARSWKFGLPAGSAVGSARGIASLMAEAVTGVEGSHPFLSAGTVEQIGQQQVRGYDEVLNQHDRAHAIVFQKPSAQLNWGGPRSFGHDGAAGAVACVDPATGLAFAYTVARGPWPGGGDPRAINLARELGKLNF